MKERDSISKAYHSTEDFPNPEDIRKQLSKILSHESFKRSERLSRFLRFVVDMALEGKSKEIKEYSIGIHVYDKDTSFDPRTDPIVRVEASRLRQKLTEYYASNSDDIRIRLQKRGYQPVIQSMKSETALHGRIVPSKATSGASLLSVVVLPFRDLSPDRSQGFFCEAITERLTSLLAKLDGVRTVAHTSAAQFLDRPDDVRHIGEELGVDALLEGSVQRSGRNVRVSTFLSRADDGFNIWNGTYDRTVKDVLTLQDDLAESVATRLRAAIAREDVLERGAAAWSHGIGECRLLRSSEWNLDLTIQAFRQSVKADAGFSRAQIRLAECLVLKMLHMDGPVDAVAEEAHRVASEAAPGNPESGVIQAVLAALDAYYDRNWKAAEKKFLRALSLDPSSSIAHDWYATLYLLPLGRFEDALSEIRFARQLDPTSIWTHIHLAWTLYTHRKYREAAEQAKFILAFEPHSRTAHWILGRAQLEIGELEASRETLEWTLEIGKDPLRLGSLGRVYCLMGRAGDARQVLHAVRSGNLHFSEYASAEIYVGLGEMSRAAEELRKAANRGVRLVNWIAVDPAFTGLQEQPCAEEVLERLDLAGSPTRSDFRRADPRVLPTLES